MDLIPDDDIPRKVVINASRIDSWTRSAAEPIGQVFLRREPGTQDVEALATVCPSNGVTLQLDRDNRVYRDPCHGNEFTLDGKRLGRNLSPRDMDSLEEAKLGPPNFVENTENWAPVVVDQSRKRELSYTHTSHTCKCV